MTTVTSLAARRLRVQRDGSSVLVGRVRLSTARARDLAEQLLDVLQYGGVSGDDGWLLRLEGDVLDLELGPERALLSHDEGLDLVEQLARVTAPRRAAQ